MEQDQAAEVWVEVKTEEGAEAGWAALLPQGREENAYAQNAARRRRTLLVHRVIEYLVPSAGR